MERLVQRRERGEVEEKDRCSIIRILRRRGQLITNRGKMPLVQILGLCQFSPPQVPLIMDSTLPKPGYGLTILQALFKKPLPIYNLPRSSGLINYSLLPQKNQTSRILLGTCIAVPLINLVVKLKQGEKTKSNRVQCCIFQSSVTM